MARNTITTSQTSEPPQWAAAQLRLRKAMADWIARSTARQRHVPWQGGHDEGSFVASWFGYYLLTGDTEVLAFLRWMREGFLDWAPAHLLHGYYASGEAHHQPENFIFFLPRLWHADPHSRVAAALDDAAHHAGNWIEGIPPWYDWERHRFRSWRLGTREVSTHPPDDLERPDHFRIIQMALCAYRAVRDERYLDLAQDFCSRWARDILDEDTLHAVRLFGSGHAQDMYPADWVQAASGSADSRLELHIAAGTADVMLDLFKLTGDETLAAAVRKLLAAGIAHVGEPYAHPLAAAFRSYRIATGDTLFDADVADRVHAAGHNLECSMLIGPPSGPHPMGIGQRRDQVRWLVSGDGETWREDLRSSPPALVLAWDITGDERLAAEAMTMAAQRMELAFGALRDGRDHGCGGRSVSAVASGHGRSAGIGEVTGVLYPLALGACRRFGADMPQVCIEREAGPGLPEGCAALWRHGRPPSVRLYNGTKQAVSLTLRFTAAAHEETATVKKITLAPGESWQSDVPNEVRTLE
jgi:hypothetical protein